MRVLHAVRQFHPSVGGIERAVLSLCAHLQRRGHECEVVTLERLWSDGRRLPTTDAVNGIQIHRLPFAGGRRYFLASGILQRASAYDLIHVHAIDFFVDFLAATRWRHRRPLVVSTHGGFFHTPWAMPAKRLYFHTVTRLALRHAARVICQSAQDDRLFARILPAGKRVQIGNGVDDRFFRVRRSPDRGLLLMVGRLAPHKGIDRAIDLLPRIARDVPAARLVVAGPDGEHLRPSLEAQAAACGVRARVSFAGPLTDDELVDHLARAHLVLAPSSYEGFGIAVAEAMAAGSVVVGSDIEAHRELIRSGDSGLLVRFDDRVEAADCIVRALQSPPARLAEMGLRARAAASAWAWDRVAEQVARVYEESAASQWQTESLARG